MSNRNIGYHVHGDGVSVKDKARLLAHVARYKPRWMLVINDIGLAHAIRAASPTTEVFIRWQQGTDNDYWIRAGAAVFLNHCLAQDPKNQLWHIGANEINNVEHDAALVEEMRRRITAGQPCPRVGVCNYSVGQPSDNPIVWDSKAGLTILKGASDFPLYIVVVLHDAYFMGYPLVGWQGNRFANPNPATWPVRGGSAFDDKGKPINWVLGRHKNAVAAFRKAYPTAPLPRFVMGEAGPENIREFISTVGRELKGGWREHIQYWRDTWNLSADAALYLCLYWLIMAGYADSPEVEAILLFAYGWNGDDKWDEFDLEPLTHFQQLLESWHCPDQLPQLKGVAPSPVPTPQPPPNAKTWLLARTLGGDYAVKLRQKPNTASAQLGAALKPGTPVLSNNAVVIGEMIRPPNGTASPYWIAVTVNGLIGYVSAAYAKLIEVPIDTWQIARALPGDYGIKLRAEPTTTSAQIGNALRDGTVVVSQNMRVDGEVIRASNGTVSAEWIPVTVNGVSGYISAAYAKLVKVAA